MVSSGVRVVMLGTFVPAWLSFCMQRLTKLGIVVHHHEPECCVKKWDSIVKVTVKAYLIKMCNENVGLLCQCHSQG